MEGNVMAEMTIVEERNQDDLSRKVGCYLYSDTKLWLEKGIVHRTDGPAIIFPDGAVRWYIHGKEITRDVYVFFLDNKWPLAKGLDTSEKIASFQAHFIKR